MKEFKKSDLTETMVCFSKIGYTYGLTEINDYDFWKDDLSSRIDGFGDIVVIYDLKDLKPIWQREEPIVLNEREKAVLVLYDEYKWIARDKSNDLYIFDEEPIKDDDIWENIGGLMCKLPPNLFQFVQWEDEEPTSLDGLRELK